MGDSRLALLGQVALRLLAYRKANHSRASTPWITKT